MGGRWFFGKNLLVLKLPWKNVYVVPCIPIFRKRVIKNGGMCSKLSFTRNE